jgi:hypothetical protein
MSYTPARESAARMAAIPGRKIMKLNYRAIAVAAVLWALAMARQNAFASDKTDVVATVHQFADNLDPKMMDKAMSACDSNTAIIDEFPPHAWNSCTEWIKDFGEYNDKNGITPLDAKIGAPWSVDIHGDRAYFVAPATYALKQHGKDVKELHSVFTAALRKTDAGWRITAWTWSKH